MKTTSTALCILSACCLSLLGPAGCGKKNSASVDGGASDGNTFLDPDTGQVFGVSSQPHPPECDIDVPPSPGRSQIAGCAAEVGDLVKSEGLCFVQDAVTPQWNNEPPSSGPQYTFPEFQYYTAAKPVPRGRYVRSLAHGYVVIVYSCPAGCQAEFDRLDALVRGPLAGLPTILTEDPLLSTGKRFAALAWNYVYNFDAVDEASLGCFVRQHQSWGLTNHVNGGNKPSQTDQARCAAPGEAPLAPAAQAD